MEGTKEETKKEESSDSEAELNAWRDYIQKRHTLKKPGRTVLLKAKPKTLIGSGGNSDTICRVCLKKGNIPIHGNDEFNDVSQDLYSCAGLSVHKDDADPKHLCKKCNSLLQSAILLRKTAQHSEQVLKRRKNSETVNKSKEKIEVEIKAELDCDQESSNAKEVEIKAELDCDQESSNADDEPQTDIIQSSTLAEDNLILDIKSKSCSNFKQNSNSTKDIKNARSKDKNPKSAKFYCKRCSIDFRTKRDYEAHILSKEHVHFKATCPICMKEFAYAYLKRHLAYHNGSNQSHICEICGKLFSFKEPLVRHRLIHFDEFPYKCYICPYRGRDNYRLTRHMLTHTSEASYKCPQCPKTCRTKNNLDKHILTHKPERDFKCDSCPLGFYRQSELDRHFKAVHLGIKDHLCQVCGKAFGLRKQMMKHTLRVHKRQKFQKGRTPAYLLAKRQEDCEQKTDILESS